MENKYPTVNYIGNKEKVSGWIVDNLPIKKGSVVLDLFCGGCSVSYELKKRGMKVFSNDALFSNYVLAKAIVENNKSTLNESDFDIYISEDDICNYYNSIKFLENKVYFDFEVKELAKLVLISNRLAEYKKSMFLALLRRSMIRKIPYSRMNVKWDEIKKFRDEQYSYKKYGRYRHYHNIPFVEHIKDNLREYNDAVFKGAYDCTALNMDAMDAIDFVDKVDLIYLDPPYPSTMNKYDEFYGKYDLMFHKEPCFKMDLTNKQTFLDNFEKLIFKAKNKTDYIAISLNNKSYPSTEQLLKKISPLIEWSEVYTKEHIYKVTGKENKHSNFEILLVCKTRGEQNGKEKDNNKSTV